MTLIPVTVQHDRAAGTVLASAAGDALGAPYEFGPSLAPDVAVTMKGGGAFGFAPGEWTDDTQMALAVLTALADPDPGANDPVPAVEAGFRAWFASGPADVGTQTTAVLSTPGPLTVAAVTYAEGHPNSAAGNGSLMRTGPVALAHPGDRRAIAALARQVSALTHADRDCADACILWSLAIDHAIHHAPTDHAYDWAGAMRLGLTLLDRDRAQRWSGLISDAVSPGAQPVDFPKNGWVVHAFQAALSAIVSTPVPPGDDARSHLPLALAHAVRAGGDTDTVAAIAGALLGARWGASAVPAIWRLDLHGRRIYGQPLLTADDLDDLARRAYTS